MILASEWDLPWSNPPNHLFPLGILFWMNYPSNYNTGKYGIRHSMLLEHPCRQKL